MKHKYKLLYKLEKRPKGVTKAEVPEGFGACDAALFCSIIYPTDGGLSIYFMGVDGRHKGEGMETLEDIEWFKVWSLLAKRLADSKTLPPEKKDVCLSAFESVRIRILGGTSLN